MMNTTPNQSRHHRSAGLTLIEILFALVIMLIGLTAIASIFPLAAHLQASSFDEIMAEQVARNAEAMIKARGFSLAALGDENFGADGLGYNRAHWEEGQDGYRYADGSGGVFPIGGHMNYWSPDGTGSSEMVPAEERWHLADRSFPTAVEDPTRREFYWTPLLRDNNISFYDRDIVAYVFVMRAEPGTDYGMGESVNWNDPPTVPKVNFNRLRVYEEEFDGYHNTKQRLGSWGLLQHFPSTVVPSESDFRRGTYEGEVSTIPEARPQHKLYQNHDGWFREYNVLSGRVVEEEGNANKQNNATQTRRETPLKRIRLVGGEFIRE